MEGLPLELATEICRCLIIAALMLSDFEGFDLTDLTTTLIGCITHYLGHSHAPFANPSTAYCLQWVATKRTVALRCHAASLHPTYATLESVLQFV
jgi:hypothetical protein